MLVIDFILFDITMLCLFRRDSVGHYDFYCDPHMCKFPSDVYLGEIRGHVAKIARVPCC